MSCLNMRDSGQDPVTTEPISHIIVQGEAVYYGYYGIFQKMKRMEKKGIYTKPGGSGYDRKERIFWIGFYLENYRECIQPKGC